MTIQATYAPVSYNGDGATTHFPFSFPIDADTDIIVTETVIALGVQTVKTLTTHYVILGGHTVVAVSPPASTVRWTISRKTPRTQLVDYVDHDAFPAETHEGALDKVTKIVQEVDKATARTLRQPDGDSTDILPIPAKIVRASKYLGFDANGDPIAATLQTAGSLVVTSFIEGLLNDGTADEARSTLNAERTTYVATVGGTTNAITLTPDPAISSYVAGQRFLFKATNTNTGDTTVNVSGLGVKTIQKTGQSGSTILYPGDIRNGAFIEIAYDGTNFNLLTPSHPQEITWTPSVGGNATYTSQNGRAWRSGMLVHIEVQITINVLGTGSGIQITGVPFAAYQAATAPVYFVGSASNVNSVVAVLSGPVITLNSIVNEATAMDAGRNIFGDGTTVWFSMDYLTAV